MQPENSGRFSPARLAEVLRNLYLQERSGILTLSRTEVCKRVHFDRGMIFFADSTLEDEGLIDFVVQNQVLDRAQASEVPGGRGDDLALARRLIASGRVEAPRLLKLIQQVIQQVILSTFRWDSGEWTFRDGPHGGSDQLRTDVMLTFGYLMRGIGSMTGFVPFRQAMLQLDRPLCMSENLCLPIEKLALHPVQGFVLSRVDGISKVREIASLIPPSEEDAALRFLFGLLILGIVEASPPLSQGALAVDDLLSGDRALRERAEMESRVIKEMYRSTSSESPLEILGVEPTASSEEMRKAYETRVDAFRTDRFLTKIQAAYREELRLIEGKLLEAYLSLVEGKVRTARQFTSEPEALTLDIDTLAKRKELTKTQTQELLEEQTRRAEQFYSKAREFFRTKDFYNAIQYCEQAVKFHGGDARYHFLMGQALMQNPDYKWQKRAEKSLLRAVQNDPWNANYLVTLGNFYRSHNLLRKAKKHFQKAAEVMPSHQEALQALKEMKDTQA